MSIKSQRAETQIGVPCALSIGNPATITLTRFRPEALRPRFSTGLPSVT